jgi:beta-glucosidase
MILQFPDHFRFGTSTAAAQIETAFQHDWQGWVANDKSVFERTTDHEHRWEEDIDIIASLADNYRMSLMWSKLQQAPLAPLNVEAVTHYRQLMLKLQEKGVDIMLVLHHFSNPIWFSEKGGWSNPESSVWWLDYVAKVAGEFGEFVALWNTFNEPNLYISLGSMAGIFPPQKKSLPHAWQVLKNMSRAHAQAYELLHTNDPGKPVGISHNCTVMEADNWLGKLPAKIADWWYMEFIPNWFGSTDYFGMSYYARIGYDPLPVTYLTTPHKFLETQKPHDDMWEYYPEGLSICLERYWKKYRKPIIITENGLCTNNDDMRIQSLHDYMQQIHGCLEKGIDIQGYYHWSTWDNFEWNLGPSYRFGLYACDWETKERIKRPSADVFASLAFKKSLEIPSSTFAPRTSETLAQ